MVEIIGVRFKSGGKQYYFDPAGLEVQPGQGVIVETSRGLEYGECAQGNTQVEEETVVQPLRPLVRIATEEDEKTVEKNREKEAKAFQICQEKIAAHGLEMKLVEAEYSFEGNKVLFFFTAEGRGGLPGPGEGPGQHHPCPHRAAADRCAGRGQDAGRPGHLRPALLLCPVPGRVPTGIH